MRRPKYRNTPTMYRGQRYDSKAEAEFAQLLDTSLLAGEILEYVRQPVVRLGVPENVYRPDFLVIPRVGVPYYVDVKGVETAKFKRDKKLWSAYGRLALLVKGRKGTETVEPADKVCLP